MSEKLSRCSRQHLRDLGSLLLLHVQDLRIDGVHYQSMTCTAYFLAKHRQISAKSRWVNNKLELRLSILTQRVLRDRIRVADSSVPSVYYKYSSTISIVPSLSSQLT